MASVLAIESHQERTAVLRDLVAGRTHADLTIVDSVDAAITAIGERVPEVILVGALMAPRDEARLTEYLRTLPKSACVQILITPSLAKPGEQPHGRRFRKFGSTPQPPACDPSAFVDQLKIYLDHVQDLRIQLAAPSEPSPADRRAAIRVSHIDRVSAVVDGSNVNLVDLSLTGAQVLSPVLLVPGRLVPVMFESEHETMSFQAGIVWGAFEMQPSTHELRYRAGVDLKDADPEFLKRICSSTTGVTTDMQTRHASRLRRPRALLSA